MFEFSVYSCVLLAVVVYFRSVRTVILNLFGGTEPTSPIQAFTELFIVGKIKFTLFFEFKNMHMTTYCIITKTIPSILSQDKVFKEQN